MNNIPYTIIFDLDGTLVDTSGDLIAAANKCFESMGFGYVLDPKIDAGVGVLGGRAMLTLGLQRAGVEIRDFERIIKQFYPRLLNYYSESINSFSFIYPGALETIKLFRRRGFRIGICTNKPELLAQKLLMSLGCRNEFDSLIGADTLPFRKPDPRPYLEAVSRAGGEYLRSCLVGDSVTDRDTAEAAKVPFIKVNFEITNGSETTSTTDKVVTDFSQLNKIINEMSR